MSTFPVLKTGVITQVPANRNIYFSTDVVQFVDGAEQRFCSYAQPYHRWSVNVAALDEAELQNIRLFIQQMDGAVGLFSFTDPWDGTVYPTCSIEGDDLSDSTAGPFDCSTQLVIREDRA